MSDRVREVALDQLVRVLDHVPLVSSIKNDMSGLRSLLYRRRPPRIAALGLPSSGRSTLLRALIERMPARDPLHADHGKWVHLDHEGAKVHWLEIDVDDSEAQSFPGLHPGLAYPRPSVLAMSLLQRWIPFANVATPPSAPNPLRPSQRFRRTFPQSD